MGNRPVRRGLLVAMACVMVLGVYGCTPRPVTGGGEANNNTPSTTTTPAATSATTSAGPPVSKLDKPVTLRVLAGSEVKDMAGVLEEASRATNVRLTFDFIGTLDGSREVASGRAARKYDAVWFPSNRYLSLLPGSSKRLGTSTKIMASPVALGLRQSVARKLGWDKKAPTWRDITAAAEAKKFTFGHDRPLGIQQRVLGPGGGGDGPGRWRRGHRRAPGERDRSRAAPLVRRADADRRLLGLAGRSVRGEVRQVRRGGRNRQLRVGAAQPQPLRRTPQPPDRSGFPPTGWSPPTTR